MQSYKAEDRFKLNISEDVPAGRMLYDKELMNPQEIQRKIFMFFLCMQSLHAVCDKILFLLYLAM